MGNIFTYTRVNLAVDSCDDDKLKEYAVAVNDDNKILDDEKRSADIIGHLTCKPEDDAYEFLSAQGIIDQKVSGESDKCNVPDEEDAYHMIIDQKRSRKSKKRPLDEDYFVFDDNYGVESSDKKRQKNGQKKAVVVGRKKAAEQNYPPPELPQNLQDYISKWNLEAPLLFVAQKVLFVSDIRRNQNRLLLPENLINTDFVENYVTDNEKKMLMEKEDVGVSLVDNKMHEYHTLNFVKWDMKCSSNYALKTAWFDVVTDNKLEEAVLQKDANKLEEAASPKKRREDVVVVMKEDDKLKSPVVAQLWCSRKEGRLWFALNIQAMTERNVVGKTKDGRNIITRLLN